MNKRQRDQIRRAAARGATWLDKNRPGWSRKIKRRQLDLNSTQFCILGQIHGARNQHAFDHEADALGLSEDQWDRLGFSLTIPAVAAGWGDDDERYGVLTAAWRDELKVRPR